jgi:hypothetical protein
MLLHRDRIVCSGRLKLSFHTVCVICGTKPALSGLLRILYRTRTPAASRATIMPRFTGSSAAYLFRAGTDWCALVGLEAHILHAATHAGALRHRRLLLRLLGHHCLGRDQQASHGSGILQRYPHDLGRVNDAGSD